jgi:hypothetical protein
VRKSAQFAGGPLLVDLKVVFEDERFQAAEVVLAVRGKVGAEFS